MNLVIAPVYIDDIIGEIVEATANAIVDKTLPVLSQKTLLETIQANETNVLGQSMIQGIRFSKSSFDELIETLAQADTSGEERYTKYPLVHLVQDISVERAADIGVYGTAYLNIIFIHQTVNTYKIEDRDEKVFKPVLYPIYYEFLNQLEVSKWTTVLGEYRHRFIKRAFWGNRQLQGSKNILNDYVDAIEIQNLQLKINYSNC